MRNKNHSFNYLFFSTLLVVFIWMMSPSVKAHIAENSVAFPFVQYEARYSISYFGIPAGESVHKLHQRQDGQYHFEARTEPNMQMLPYHYHESTDFAFEDGKFIPQNYYYNVKEGKRRKKGNVIFDRDSNTIRNKGLKEPWQTELTEGIQDKLTQTLCIRHALKAGTSDLNYMVAEEDKIKNYVFSIVGEEQLKTKLGSYRTVKVEHVSRKGIRTTLWLAKPLDYLPVKMTQMRQGKVVANGEIMTFTPRRDTNARANS